MFKNQCPIPSPKNPYQRGLWPLFGLFGLFLLAAVLARSFTSEQDGFLLPLAWISLAMSGFFGLLTLIVWLLGVRQLRQIRAFLASERPLLRWDYTPEEWRTLKEAVWQEQQGDWRLQFGCLTFLFGLVGLLVGGMLGAEEGFSEAVSGGLSGLMLGATGGAMLGAVVATGNYLAARSAYRQPEPDPVALAPHEIYANGAYFRGNGVHSYIQKAELQRGDPSVLRLELRMPPRPRMPDEEEWQIIVPPRMIEAVESALPALTGGQS